MNSDLSTAAPGGYSPLVERALRVASIHHHSQRRKGGAVPYITHPCAMALILQQHGIADEATLAVALLHDVVEDTDCTLDELAAQFPPVVIESVAAMTERKRDEHGAARPWRDRKLEHIEHMANAPWRARAVVLADKLHNLYTMCYDLEAGEDVWGRFNASRSDVEWYHRAMTDAAARDQPRLATLAAACLRALESLPRGAD